ECPYPRADGSIVETPGYDPETAILYVPALAFPAVPSQPSQADAQAAWARLSDLVRQFPFASDADKAVWLSALLTAIGRPAIDGPVPGIAVIGNKAGTGKGLLINTIGLIALGRKVPTTGYPFSTEEAAKVKVALALDGTPLIHLDNVPEGLGFGNSA